MAFIRSNVSMNHNIGEDNHKTGCDFNNFTKKFSRLRSEKFKESIQSSENGNYTKIFGTGPVLLMKDDKIENSEDITNTGNSTPISFDIVLGEQNKIIEFINKKDPWLLYNRKVFYDFCSNLVRDFIPHGVGGGRLICEIPTNVTLGNASEFIGKIKSKVSEVIINLFRLPQTDEYQFFNQSSSSSSSSSSTSSPNDLFDKFTLSFDGKWLKANKSHTSFFSSLGERSSDCHISLGLVKSGVSNFNLCIVIHSYWLPATERFCNNLDRISSHLETLKNKPITEKNYDSKTINRLDSSLTCSLYSDIDDISDMDTDNLQIDIKNNLFSEDWNDVDDDDDDDDSSSSSSSLFYMKNSGSARRNRIEIEGKQYFHSVCDIEYCNAISKFHRRCVLTTLVSALSEIHINKGKTIISTKLFRKPLQELRKTFVQMPCLSKTALLHSYGSDTFKSSIRMEGINSNKLLKTPVFFNLISREWYRDYTTSGWRINSSSNKSRNYVCIGSNKIHVDLLCFGGFPLSFGELGTSYIRFPPYQKPLDNYETKLKTIKKMSNDNINSDDIDGKYKSLSEMFENNDHNIDDANAKRKKRENNASSSLIKNDFDNDDGDHILNSLFSYNVDNSSSSSSREGKKINRTRNDTSRARMSEKNGINNIRTAVIKIEDIKSFDMFGFYCGSNQERRRGLFPSFDNYFNVHIAVPSSPLLSICKTYNDASSSSSSSSSSSTSNINVTNRSGKFHSSTIKIGETLNEISKSNFDIRGDTAVLNYKNVKHISPFLSPKELSRRFYKDSIGSNLTHVYKKYDGNDDDIENETLILPYQIYMVLSKMNILSSTLKNDDVIPFIKNWLNSKQIPNYMFNNNHHRAPSISLSFGPDIYSKVLEEYKRSINSKSTSSSSSTQTSSKIMIIKDTKKITKEIEVITSNMVVISFKSIDSHNIKNLPINPDSDHIVLSQNHIGNIVNLDKPEYIRTLFGKELYSENFKDEYNKILNHREKTQFYSLNNHSKINSSTSGVTFDDTFENLENIIGNGKKNGYNPSKKNKYPLRYGRKYYLEKTSNFLNKMNK